MAVVGAGRASDYHALLIIRLGKSPDRNVAVFEWMVSKPEYAS
jgi:hypothetical protein